MIKKYQLTGGSQRARAQNVRLFKECDEDVEKAEHNPS